MVRRDGRTMEDPEGMVPKGGFEPPRAQGPLRPERSASASSATSAPEKETGNRRTGAGRYFPGAQARSWPVRLSTGTLGALGTGRPCPPVENPANLPIMKQDAARRLLTAR